MADKINPDSQSELPEMAAEVHTKAPQHIALQPGQHAEIIGQLTQTKEFDLQGLKGETLAPQELAEVWDRPEVLQALNEYLALPKSTPNQVKEREAFLHNNDLLGPAVQETRQILHVNKHGGTNPEGQEVKGTVETAAADKAESFWADYQMDNPESECSEECESDILAKLTLLASKGLDFEAKKPVVDQLITKLISNDEAKAVVKQLETEDVTVDSALKEQDEQTLIETSSEERKEVAKENFLKGLESIGGSSPKGIEDLIAAAGIVESIPDKAIRTEVLSHLNSIKSKLSSAVQLGKTPEEQAAIQAVVANGPVVASAQGAAVYMPTVNLLLANPDISDEAKSDIEAHFGIVKKFEHPDTTGSDVNKALEAGQGMDEEGNPIPYTEDQPLEPRPNMKIYEEPGGEKTIKITVGNRVIETRLSEDVLGNDLGKVANTMAVMQVAESMGLNSVFFAKGQSQEGSGVVSIDPDDIRDARTVMSSFLGAFTGFDGEIMSEQDMDRLRHNFQWLRNTGTDIAGDGGTGDNDVAKAKEDLRGLGILDGDTLNNQKLRSAGLYIQQHARTSASPYDELQSYLETV